MSIRIELACCTETLIAEIADPASNRDVIVSTYGLAILSSVATDWATVNAAIIARWSLAGLLYIKKKAWNRVEKMRAAKQ